MGVKGVEFIAIGLNKYSCLKVLNINNNQIMDEGIILLSSVLINNTALKSLNIGAN